jgi:hypothetical protein
MPSLVHRKAAVMLVRKRFVASLGVVGLTLGVLASPAAAIPHEKTLREAAREYCSTEEEQQSVALVFNTKANRGHCQHVIVELLD